MMTFFVKDSDDKEEDEMPEPMTKKEIDPWDLAREISVLDDLNMTGQERKWKQEREQKLQNQKQGPKLKDLVKASNSNKQLDNDAFMNAVANTVDNSMAIVPAANWNQPLYAPTANPYGNSMSIVPYGAFPAMQGQAPAQMMYGYQYPAYYPPAPQQQQQQQYPQQFSWN